MRAFIVLLASALSCLASTVEINLRDYASTSLNTQVIITNLSNPTFGGTNVYALPSQKFQPRNGQVSAVLHAGAYRALIGPYTIGFNVPDDNATYQLADLATNGVAVTAISTFYYPRSNPSNYVTSATVDTKLNTTNGEAVDLTLRNGGGQVVLSSDRQLWNASEVPVIDWGQRLFYGDWLREATGTQALSVATYGQVLGVSNGTISQIQAGDAAVSNAAVAAVASEAVARAAADGRVPVTNSPSSMLVFEGDSITQGNNTPGNEWPTRFMELPLFNGSRWTNVAVQSETLSNITSQYTTEVYPHRPSANGGTNAWVFVWIGANDASRWSTNASAYVSALESYWTNARADGFKVAAFTVMRESNYWQGTNKTAWQLVNAGIRRSTNYDRLIDADSFFNDVADTNLFSDGIHPTAAGNQKLARFVQSQMLAASASELPSGSAIKYIAGPLEIGGNASLTDQGKGATIYAKETNATATIWAAASVLDWVPVASSGYTGIGQLTTIRKSGNVYGQDVIGTSSSASASGTANMNSATAFSSGIENTISGGGTMYSAYHYLANSPYSSGTIDTAIGLYVKAQKASGVSKGFGIYQEGATDTNYFAGSLRAAAIYGEASGITNVGTNSMSATAHSAYVNPVTYSAALVAGTLNVTNIAPTNGTSGIRPLTLSSSGAVSWATNQAVDVAWRRKASDTSRQSTVTLTDDPDLSVALSETGTYQVECFLMMKVESATAGSLTKLAYTGSKNTSVGIVQRGANGSAPVSYGSPDYSGNDMLFYGLGRADQEMYWRYQGLVTVTTTGTLSMQWAQLVSEAVNTTVRAGSYLHVKKLP